jgi:hypothetical protein
MATRAIPPAVHTRIERWWRPETIDVWWTKPVARCGGRRPCEMPDWELAELLDKIEQGRELSGLARQM